MHILFCAASTVYADNVFLKMTQVLISIQCTILSKVEQKECTRNVEPVS